MMTFWLAHSEAKNELLLSTHYTWKPLHLLSVMSLLFLLTGQPIPTSLVKKACLQLRRLLSKIYWKKKIRLCCLLLMLRTTVKIPDACSFNKNDAMMGIRDCSMIPIMRLAKKPHSWIQKIIPLVCVWKALFVFGLRTTFDIFLLRLIN